VEGDVGSEVLLAMEYSQNHNAHFPLVSGLNLQIGWPYKVGDAHVIHIYFGWTESSKTMIEALTLVAAAAVRMWLEDSR